jgi:hypothetical protein
VFDDQAGENLDQLSTSTVSTRRTLARVIRIASGGKSAPATGNEPSKPNTSTAC